MVLQKLTIALRKWRWCLPCLLGLLIAKVLQTATRSTKEGSLLSGSGSLFANWQQLLSARDRVRRITAISRFVITFQQCIYHRRLRLHQGQQVWSPESPPRWARKLPSIDELAAETFAETASTGVPMGMAIEGASDDALLVNSSHSL